MKVYAALCLGAFALYPAVSLKLSDSFAEEQEGTQSNSSPDSSSPALNAGALDELATQQSSSGSNLEAYAGKTAWDAATEAQVFADAAAAAAEADQPDIAQRFADAAAAAADEAAALAMSSKEEGKPEGDRTEDPNLAVFAPRNFRFVDAAGGRVLNVYFHNAFEPFDTVGCSDIQSSLAVCAEHPRCAVERTSAGGDARCLVSRSYLALAASTLCARTAEGVSAPTIEGRELKSVIVDLMRELAIDPKPLLEALDAAGATDAETLCGLAQELASEVLATERNIQTPDTKLYSQTLIAEDGGVEGLLESSLGFVAGGGQEPNALGIPRVISARPHNQLSTEETKPATASALRATGATPGNERIRIGINGFGRIGRLVFRIASKRPDMAVTHINSSMSPEYIAYMLKYDSAHGRFPGDVDVRDGSLYVNGRRIHLTASRDPTEINWQESGTDFVCESTGAFCTLKDAGKHVDRTGGARHAVISAPAKDEATPTLVVGVNAETEYKPEMRVVSCASCTTNGLAPLVKVIDSHFGIEEGLMTTVHAVTGTQRVVDMSSNKDWRGGRAAGFNIIPSATGAAKAVARCLPQMKGKLTGMAFRVPTIDVSVVDLTCRLKKSTSYEEIKAAVKAAAEGEMRGILGYTEEAVVSSDIMGSECSSVFDASAGIMLNPNFVKLVSWYDNEFAYSARLVDLIAIMAAKDGLVPEGTGLARKPF